MTEFDILSTNPLPSSLFLQASAGTGKTFTLEHLYIRRLIDHTLKPVEIEQLLVVTFTKAASKELKSRIKEKIKATIKELEEKSSQTSYLKPIIQNPESLETALYQLKKHCFAFIKLKSLPFMPFAYKL